MPYPFFGNPAVYVDPAIVTFVAIPALAERGSTVDAVVLKWSTSKTPDLLKLDGNAITPFTRQTLIEGPFTDDASWKLACADKQRSVQAKATLSFVNRVFHGLVNAAPTDSAGLLALDSELSINRRRSTVIGANTKVFCYAYPKRLGAARVSVEVSSNQWQPTTTSAKFTDYTTTTVSFTNGSGYTEDYTVLTFNTAFADNTIIHVE